MAGFSLAQRRFLRPSSAAGMIDMEGFELVVVVVLALEFMMREAAVEIALRRGAEAQQNVGIDGAVAGRAPPWPARFISWSMTPLAAMRSSGDIWSFLLRMMRSAPLIWSSVRRSGSHGRAIRPPPLRGHCLRIVGEALPRRRHRIDHGDHPIDGDVGAHLRPVEGADQRLRQRSNT